MIEALNNIFFSGKCIDFKGKETISVNYTFDGEKFEEIELKDNYGLIYQKQCNYLNLVDHTASPEDGWFIWKVEFQY